MYCATITISDNTKTPQNLLTLLGKGNQTAYTVVPASGLSGLTTLGGVSYVSVQSSYGNGGTIVYEGDENVKTDGTRQGKELQAGDVDVHQANPMSTHLAEIYITASA